MSKARQTTLQEKWGGGRVNQNDTTGAGPSASLMRPPRIPFRNPGTARGAGRGRGRGAGRGRGRGRGREGSSASVSTGTAEVIELEDEEDDAFLDQAMMNYEMNSNTISQAFQELNSATELPGFERSAGDIWIYPTNRQVRDYQFNIVKTALYHNTLVSLPTGLGKTFIAAVVMYNFHRWYPNNLIIFMAPTKPLVTQQLEACHNLMGIKPNKMIELTGQIAPKRREEIWKERKVFFLTPQVLTSDLNRGFCPADMIRCIVVDEAHKATGNYAYSQVISMVVEKTKCFRVLALSATPGNDLNAVQEVLKNLLIAKIELRTETSYDILPYTHEKKVETIVVPLDQHIKEVQDKVVEILQVYTGRLMKDKFLSGKDAFSFTQYNLVRARDAARQRLPPNMPTYQKKAMEINFNTCISLAHALDLLLTHGLRSFHIFLNSVMEKSKGNPVVAAELRRETNIEEILSQVQTKLNISLDTSVFDLSAHGLFTTTSPKPRANASLVSNPANPDDYMLSHPKMIALKNLVDGHFKNSSSDTRIMIFSKYRDSVQEIGNMLNGLGPNVRPMVFFGQTKAGAGGTSLKQKDQAQVVRQFRSGGFNVLVSTSVGEEGLDIGEVDLIICFDSSASPTRLVQRMGRTGRKREGKIIFLLTQGKEQQMYYSSLSKQSSVSKNITDASLLETYLYQESPRMVPLGVTPECYKMDIILSSEQNHLPPTQPDVGELSNPTLVPRTNIFGNANKKASAPKEAGITTKVKVPKELGKTAKANSNKKDSKKHGAQDADQNTITQCQLNIRKETNLPPKTAVPEPPMEDIIEENDLPMQYDSAYIMNDTYDSSESTVGYGQQYRAYLSKMLGVREVTSDTTSRCVFLTPAPRDQNTALSKELENISSDDLVSALEGINLEVIREKLNAAYTLGPTTMCSCGMYNADVSQSDFYIDDFIQTEAELVNEIGENAQTSHYSSPKPGRSCVASHPKAEVLDSEFEVQENIDEDKPELSLADIDIALLFDDEFEDTNEGSWLQELPEINNASKQLENAPLNLEEVLNNDNDPDSALSTPSTTFDEEEFNELDALEPLINYPTRKPDSPISLVRESDGFRVMSQVTPRTPCRLNQLETKPEDLIDENVFPILDDDLDADIILASPPKPKKKFIFKRNMETLGLKSSTNFGSINSNNINQQGEAQVNMLKGENTSDQRVKESHTGTSNHSISSWNFGKISNVVVESKQNTATVSNHCLSEVIQTKRNMPAPLTLNNNLINQSDSSDEDCIPLTPPSKKKFVFKKKPAIINPSPKAKVTGPVVEPVVKFCSPNNNNLDSSNLKRNLFSYASVGSPNLSPIAGTSTYVTAKNQNTLRVSTPVSEFSRPTICPTRKWTSKTGASTKQSSSPQSSVALGSVTTPTPTTYNLVPGVIASPNQSLNNSSRFSPSLNQNTWNRPSVGNSSPKTPENRSIDQSPNITNPRRKRRRKKNHANPFVESQAEATDSDSSNEEGSDSDLDEYDRSFVDEEENSELYSESQQVRYVKSLANVSPMVQNINRIVSRLEANHNNVNYPHDSSETPNEDDEMESFCVANNDIEFEEIGVFTQAMVNAAEEVALETPGGNRFRRKLRSKTKLEAVAIKQPPKKPKDQNGNGNKKQRKRIRMLSSDSEDE